MDAMFPHLYPLNKSLQEELKRLFWLTSHHRQSCFIYSNDDVTAEFRLNGQDSEYCPEFLPNNDKYKFYEINGLPDDVPGAMSIRSKKRSKKQSHGCPFCKNNGEEENFYKKHALKDSEGRTSCPILRAYTCPICSASGDKAHTIKYCPKNMHPQNVATMIALKSRRNAVGQKRTKSISSM